MSYQAGLMVNGASQMVSYNTKQSSAVKTDAGEASFIGAVSESIKAQLGAVAVAEKGTVREADINQQEAQFEKTGWMKEEEEALQFINKIEKILGRSQA
ncbi:MAG: hypothetical protein WC901_03030 [Candidatus Margulisiibacteriota bacterium]